MKISHQPINKIKLKWIPCEMRDRDGEILGGRRGRRSEQHQLPQKEKESRFSGRRFWWNLLLRRRRRDSHQNLHHHRSRRPRLLHLLGTLDPTRLSGGPHSPLFFFFFSISSKSPFYLLLPLLLIVTTVIFNWFREIGTVDFLGQGSLDWMRSSGVVFIIWWPINSMVLIVETTQKPGIVSGEFWSVFQLYEWISIVAA